jgi:ATP-dependent DNA helicase RecG
MLTLDTKISSLGRIGKTASRYLKNLDILTVQDIIFYYPTRYDDLSQIVPIGQLEPWTTVTVKGKVELIQNKRSLKKHTMITEAIVSDGTGKMKVVWFNQAFIGKVLKNGDEIYLSGKVDQDYYGIQMIAPVYEKVMNTAPTHTARIVPVYSLTERLSEKQIRFLIKMSLVAVNQVIDPLPKEIKKKYNLPNLPEALSETHFPTSFEKLELARRRLKFDELFLLALRNELTRFELKKNYAPAIPFCEPETRAFVSSLPFTLTKTQKISAWEILKDLEKENPMNRLLDGDVGSGKTVVAAIAILNAVLSGYQSAIMAPTEILARQHFESLTKMFPNNKVGLLTSNFAYLSSSGEISKKQLLEEITVGGVEIVIGTHALIQESVKFKKLGLAIVDEQHRFGVDQRAALKRSANLTASRKPSVSPHFLTMTATPIPRTLALSAYGDLDISVINEQPKDRLPIITRIIRAEKRKEAYKFVRDEIKKGRQAFVICPLIDPSDKLGVKSVKEEYEKLQEVFPEFVIGLMHGKLKPAEKENIMDEFSANKINILVSTSVVEVGVDIPNATIMIIEGAERFGLAQLHQFRGRIGRSSYQSYCFTVQENFSQVSTERLRAFETCRNGFLLAEKDLEFRGHGDILGTRQSGKTDFQIASFSDVEIMKQARDVAQELVGADSALSSFPLLKNKIEEFEAKIHLE